jgi:[FeFe] hydrogenase H-cluster maturation GTPase HydF
VQKTRQVFDRTDVGILVVDAAQWGEYEDGIFRELRDRNIPIVIAFNKSDIARPLPAAQETLRRAKIPSVETVASENRGVVELREALVQVAPDEFLQPPALVADLVPPSEMAVLVVPIDTEAPKGRLIVPQVQAIRDLLDGDAYCLVVKERELRDALGRLNRPPALVVTDSQAFLKVAADTPPEVKMTSFSILFARQKGDLRQFVEGALSIERLRPGDRVLVAESCAHHPIGDDIGRVKIPRWLTQYVGGELRIDTTQGHEFPANLSDYRLVVHCGACMWNRREMLTRMAACRRAGVPICNYGMTIAFTLGIFDRALAPFPDAMEAYRELKSRQGKNRV